MSNYPDDMNWKAYEAAYGEWRPTREECHRDIRKLADQFGPQIKAAFTNMFRKYGADDAALTGTGNWSFEDILDELLCDAAYEAINEFIPEDGE